MEKQTQTEKVGRGLAAAELEDLMDAKWSTPREFTLAEVEAFAPLLGMTAHEFITEVLS